MSEASILIRLRQSVLPGLTTGLLLLAVTMTAASFIFSGYLAIFLPVGLGISLISSVIVGALVCLRGSYFATIGSAALVPAALVGVMAASISESFGELGSIQAAFSQLLPTILMAIAISTLFTGGLYYFLGRFSMGRLIRFIPYPVMGGFLAGVGWLLVSGSINVMRRIPLRLDNPFLHINNPETLRYLLPGVVFALILLLLRRFVSHYMVLPSALILAIGLFYTWVYFNGWDLFTAVSYGWIVEPFSSQSVWRSFQVTDYQQVRWDLILSHWPDILSIVFVSAFALLFTAVGIEADVDHDMQLNLDLRAAGIGNALAGLAGGIIGYHSLLLTHVNKGLGARHRMSGLVAVMLAAIVAILVAPNLVYVFPKPILGGLLLYFGLSIMLEWLFSSYRRLALSDYLLLVLIFLCTAWIGFMQAIIVGLAISTRMFVVQYSRLDIVKHYLSGTIKRSQVDRSLRHDNFLNRQGHLIHILYLEGFVFFGTAYNLYQLVKQRTLESFPRYLILDFAGVTGIDSTALHSFSRIRKLIVGHDGHIILSSLVPHLEQTFKQAKLLPGQSKGMELFRDADHALEWCEDMLIEHEKGDEEFNTDLDQLLTALFNDKAVADAFSKHLTRLDIRRGEYLFKQGDEAKQIFLLESGLASIYLELANGRKRRLRKVKEGAIVGEMGVISGAPRSASFIADKDSTFYVLTSESLDQLHQRNPSLAVKFHEVINKLLSERLNTSNQLLAEM